MMPTFEQAVAAIGNEELVRLALISTLGKTTADQPSELEYTQSDLVKMRDLLVGAKNALPNSDDVTVCLANINLEYYKQKVQEIIASCSGNVGMVKLGADFYEFEKLILSFQHVKGRAAEDFDGLSHAVHEYEGADLRMLHLTALFAITGRVIQSVGLRDTLGENQSWWGSLAFTTVAAIGWIMSAFYRCGFKNPSPHECVRQDLQSFVAGHDAMKTNFAAYFAVKLMSITNCTTNVITPEWDSLNDSELRDAFGKIFNEADLLKDIEQLSKVADGFDSEKVHLLIQKVSLRMNQIFDHDKLMELAIIWAKTYPSACESKQDMIQYLHSESFSRWPFADFSVFKIWQLQYSNAQLEQFCGFANNLSAGELRQFEMFCQADFAGQSTTVWDSFNVPSVVVGIIKKTLDAMKQGADAFIDNTLNGVFKQQSFTSKEEKFIATRLLTCTRLNLNPKFKDKGNDEDKQWITFFVIAGAISQSVGQIDMLSENQSWWVSLAFKTVVAISLIVAARNRFGFKNPSPHERSRQVFVTTIKAISADPELVDWLGKDSQLEFDYLPELLIDVVGRSYHQAGKGANNARVYLIDDYASRVNEIIMPLLKLMAAYLKSQEINSDFNTIVNWNDFKHKLLASFPQEIVNVQSLVEAIESYQSEIEPAISMETKM